MGNRCRICNDKGYLKSKAGELKRCSCNHPIFSIDINLHENPDRSWNKTDVARAVSSCFVETVKEYNYLDD